MYSLYNITRFVRMKRSSTSFRDFRESIKYCTLRVRVTREFKADQCAEARTRHAPLQRPRGRRQWASAASRPAAPPPPRTPHNCSFESVYFYRVERGPRSTPRAPLLAPRGPALAGPGPRPRPRGSPRPRPRWPLPAAPPSLALARGPALAGPGPRPRPRWPGTRPRPRWPPFRNCTIPAPPGILRTRFSTRRL
jgi:hypothetical protein